jgi:hypothetical protein
MGKVEMVKTAVGVAVSLGVGAIVENAIKATTPKRIGMITKICTVIGAFVLSGIAGDKAVKYTDEKIDTAVSTLKKMADEGELN